MDQHEDIQQEERSPLAAVDTAIEALGDIARDDEHETIQARALDLCCALLSSQRIPEDDWQADPIACVLSKNLGTTARQIIAATLLRVLARCPALFGQGATFAGAYSLSGLVPDDHGAVRGFGHLQLGDHHHLPPCTAPSSAREMAGCADTSYVATKSRIVANYFTVRAMYYAIAVLGLALVYSGRADPQFLLLFSVFVAVGLLCMLLPPLVIQRIINQAREQLAASVDARYRSEILSVASQPSVHDAVTGPRLTEAAAAQLSRFQELLQVADRAEGVERQILAVIPAVLSQGLPYLGFVLSDMLKRVA